MTQALQAIDQLSPGMRMVVIVLAVFGSVGGGGFGVFSHLDQQFVRLHDALDEQKTVLERQNSLLQNYAQRISQSEWTVALHGGRLDGQATKNREQDRRLRALELDHARSGVRGTYPNADWELTP